MMGPFVVLLTILLSAHCAPTRGVVAVPVEAPDGRCIDTQLQGNSPQEYNLLILYFPSGVCGDPAALEASVPVVCKFQTFPDGSLGCAVTAFNQDLAFGSDTCINKPTEHSRVAFPFVVTSKQIQVLNCPHVTSVAFLRLVTISSASKGLALIGNSALGSANFPALRTISAVQDALFIDTNSNLGLLQVSALQQVTGANGIVVARNFLASLRFDSLVTVTTQGLGIEVGAENALRDASFPNLQRVVPMPVAGKRTRTSRAISPRGVIPPAIHFMSCGSLSSISFPVLVELSSSAGQGIRLASLPKLASMYFPSLSTIQTAGGGVTIESVGTLSAFSFPKLLEIRSGNGRGLSVFSNLQLAQFSFPALGRILSILADRAISIDSNPALTKVDLSLLQAVQGTVYVWNQVLLPTFSLPSLTSLTVNVCDGTMDLLSVDKNSRLTSVSLYSWKSHVCNGKLTIDTSACVGCDICHDFRQLSSIPDPKLFTLTNTASAPYVRTCGEGAGGIQVACPSCVLGCDDCANLRVPVESTPDSAPLASDPVMIVGDAVILAPVVLKIPVNVSGILFLDKKVTLLLGAKMYASSIATTPSGVTIDVSQQSTVFVDEALNFTGPVVVVPVLETLPTVAEGPKVVKIKVFQYGTTVSGLQYLSLKDAYYSGPQQKRLSAVACETVSVSPGVLDTSQQGAISVTLTLTPSADTTSPGCMPPSVAASDTIAGLPKMTFIAIVVGACGGGLVVMAIIVIIIYKKVQKKRYWGQINQRVNEMQSSSARVASTSVQEL